MSKYLTNAELMEKLNRIEEVAEQLRKEVKINNEAHEHFYKEFMEKFSKEDEEIAGLKKSFSDLYKKYFTAKERLKSE
jgi:predicted solute-binding protein